MCVVGADKAMSSGDKCREKVKRDYSTFFPEEDVGVEKKGG
jgi:hypothetical protein